uniref:Uncharacterized protein n=1 Tax=Strombidium rassoulzadegani TaxID=1082188 RepID=A0A7S3CTL8_9SPIT|mmetsp:Transcript_8413/g.14084  ORF Transcript_8413/g.14084 Transcript_8413/m.14084 type:complete len:136 (+) Transcript_8413:425-832(+)
MFRDGIIFRDGEAKTLSHWMDCNPKDCPNEAVIVPDEGAAVLFKTDGSYQERASAPRYTQGYLDIVKRHLVERGDAPSHQVVAVVSHSCGINPFLKLFGHKEGIQKPCYCCTIAVELERDEATGFKVNELTILQK